MKELLRIGEREYSKTGSPLLFRVPLSDLGEVRFVDVPFYSTLEVENLPGNVDSYILAITATHAGGPHHEEFYLNFHVNFWQPGGADDPSAIAACTRKLHRIKRCFREFVESGLLDDGDGDEPRSRFRGKWYCGVLYSAAFTRQDNPRLTDLVHPFVDRFERLVATPDRLLFLCHATEDKHFVDRLAAYLDTREVPIWYDKREIRLGESIVARINEGLEAASHLVIILSKASVSKPWVQRELSAGLMKHLKDGSIKIIPLLREPCSIPALLADLKYADCRSEIECGFRDLADDVSGS
jgi:hypothetical protein